MGYEGVLDIRAQVKKKLNLIKIIGELVFVAYESILG